MSTPASDNTLILTYTDGAHDEFRFPHQAESAKVPDLLESILNQPVLCLQLEDRLVAIPTRNIRSAELIPAPKDLPATVIHHAKRIHKLH